MTKYACGCESDGIVIMSNNIYDFIVYNEWAESVGVLGTTEECLYCYLDRTKIKMKAHCGYKEGRWSKKAEKVK